MKYPEGAQVMLSKKASGPEAHKYFYSVNSWKVHSQRIKRTPTKKKNSLITAITNLLIPFTYTTVNLQFNTVTKTEVFRLSKILGTMKICPAKVRVFCRGLNNQKRTFL